MGLQFPNGVALSGSVDAGGKDDPLGRKRIGVVIGGGTITIGIAIAITPMAIVV